MYDNDECTSRNFGDSSHLTNWIIDSVYTCHMTPEVSDFIPGFLDNTDKHIEVLRGHHVMAKQKGQVRRYFYCSITQRTFGTAKTSPYSVLRAHVLPYRGMVPTQVQNNRDAT